MRFVLSKMRVEKPANVQYTLKDENSAIVMNNLIGKEIQLVHTGKRYCSVCGNDVKKFFGQGFCYPCFANAPQNSECIIRPELCLGHEGEGRDPEWELTNHVQNHIVYLALTSAVKVGVTRETNILSRWIDQGAWKTIVLAEVPNRYIAGCIEVALKNFMTDKTNWRKMLKNEMAVEVDLAAFKNDLLAKVPVEYKEYLSSNNELLEITYPVTAYPEKVASLNFDKTPEITGTLLGIRGQYLYFEGGKVLNIRKFTGYEVDLTFNESALTEEAKQMSLF